MIILRVLVLMIDYITLTISVNEGHSDKSVNTDILCLPFFTKNDFLVFAKRTSSICGVMLSEQVGATSPFSVRHHPAEVTHHISAFVTRNVTPFLAINVVRQAHLLLLKYILILLYLLICLGDVIIVHWQ